MTAGVPLSFKKRVPTFVAVVRRKAVEKKQTKFPMADFSNCVATMENVLTKMKLIEKGKSLAEAELDPSWIARYGEIARRVDDLRRSKISSYPYEAGNDMSPTAGGYFSHPEWPVRVRLEKQKSLHSVSQYEANYINATGYWLSLYEACSGLMEESLRALAQLQNGPQNAAAWGAERDKAVQYMVWNHIFVRYGLRVIGLRTLFYQKAAQDPVGARLMMPRLEARATPVPADDLRECMQEMDRHDLTQMMKALANLTASNKLKRSNKKDGSAADQ